jgi:trans-2,3-dihydro-3-hydroxyanthranilate isomerase
MAHRFLLVDVFTDQPFGGNQLAVFPCADDIAPSRLQAIARELNFTETSFVYTANGAVDSARLRIFTPDAEVPYAGHPVIGTAFALEAEGRISRASHLLQLQLEAGLVPVRLDRGDGATLLQATMTQERPSFIGQFHRRELVAASLGLDAHALAVTGLPCEIVSTGLPIHIVPIADLDAMRRIRVQPEAMSRLAEALGFGDVFVFTFDTVDPSATVHCRMFAPSFGIPEDPATGAASGALGAYLVKNRAVPLQRHLRIVSEQGLEMGRPSRISIEVESDDGRILAVRVGGSAVIVGSGELRV